MRLRLSVLALLASWVFTSSASAASVSIYFTGTFSSIEPNAFYAYSQAGVHIGSLATGRITIDTSLPDLFPIDPTHGEYYGLLGDFSVSSGSWSATKVLGGENFTISVFDQNQPAPVDAWRMYSTVTVTVPAGDPGLRAFEVYLGDNGIGSNIVGDSILPPSGASWGSQSSIALYLPCSLGCGASVISLTSVVVPEPSPLLLLVLLAGIVSTRHGVKDRRPGSKAAE